MALAYSQFGVKNLTLYTAYLATFYDVASFDTLVEAEGVFGGVVESDGSAAQPTRGVECSEIGYFATLLRNRAGCVDRDGVGGCIGGSRGGIGGGCAVGCRGTGEGQVDGTAGGVTGCGSEGEILGNERRVGETFNTVGSANSSGRVGLRVDGVSAREKRKAKAARHRRNKRVGKHQVVVEGEPEVVEDVVPEWRRKSVERKGYFDELDESTRKALKETRAQLLIEKNRRELAQEKKKVKQMDSPMAAVAEVLRAMAVVERIAKKENDDSRVLGWAKTVTENYAATISGTGSSEGAARSATVASSVSANSSVSRAGVKTKPTVGLFGSDSKLKKEVQRDVDVGVVGTDRDHVVSPEVMAIDKKVAALRVAAGREVCTRPDRFVRWLITNRFVTDVQITMAEKLLGRLPKPADYLNGTLLISSDAKIMIAEMKHAFF